MALIPFAFLAITSSGYARSADPAPVPFKMPADATIPSGPRGDAIKLGRDYLREQGSRGDWEIAVGDTVAYPGGVSSLANCVAGLKFT